MLICYLLGFSSNVHITFKFKENMQQIIKPSVHFMVKITGIVFEFIVKTERMRALHICKIIKCLIFTSQQACLYPHCDDQNVYSTEPIFL